jgi:hypothetical protein
MSIKALKFDKTLIAYIFLCFAFGYYWRIWQIELNDLKVDNPKYRFLIRFLFGLGFYVLGMAYFRINKLSVALKYLTIIYLSIELTLLFIGGFRLFVYDHPVIISLYASLLGLTVSPLALLLALVLSSLDLSKSKHIDQNIN